MPQPQDIVVEETEKSLEIQVRQKVESLNPFMGFKDKQGMVSPLPTLEWINYKKRWARTLTIAPLRTRREFMAYTTIICYRNRLIDKENLYGGSKPIRDTLERRGWIWNDSPNWGDLHVLQKKCKKEDERTIIRVDIIEKEN